MSLWFKSSGIKIYINGKLMENMYKFTKLILAIFVYQEYG